MKIRRKRLVLFALAQILVICAVYGVSRHIASEQASVEGARCKDAFKRAKIVCVAAGPYLPEVETEFDAVETAANELNYAVQDAPRYNPIGAGSKLEKIEKAREKFETATARLEAKVLKLALQKK